METAKCSRCERRLPLDRFAKDACSSRGRHSACKFCCNWVRARIKGNPKDFTHLEHDPCHICGVTLDYFSMAIDHCHVSGEVRGRLCMFCNTSLGKMKDDVELLKKAIKYLERHKK